MQDSNTTACLIPARLNSTRFPGKLLKMVHGKTVLQRTIESALQYFPAKRLFVATDHEEIARHVEPFGVTPIWTSPTCPSGTDRIAEAVLKTPALQNTEIIVNLQGDYPLTPPKTLSAAIGALQSDVTAAMSTVAAPIHTLEDFVSPHVVKVVLDPDSNALYFSRSPIPFAKEGVPPNALHHIGLYCFRRPFLLQYPQIKPTPLQRQEDLEQLKLLESGWKIKVAIVDEKIIGIDVPEDLRKLEERIRQHVD
jgi:3-deoxy-manno-octulosonate cytidylyltransferase (CMP-KDO synthetase)